MFMFSALIKDFKVKNGGKTARIAGQSEFPLTSYPQDTRSRIYSRQLEWESEYILLEPMHYLCDKSKKVRKACALSELFHDARLLASRHNEILCILKNAVSGQE